MSSIPLPNELEPASAAAADALVDLGRRLLASGYRFTTVTPDTHRLVLARMPAASGYDSREVFGWNRAVLIRDLPRVVRDRLETANALDDDGVRVRSRVRYSTIGDAIFVHSAYPTSGADSVFFGPDTYRFVQFVGRHLPRPAGVPRIVDVGCGSGAGGLAVARELPDAVVALADINREALRHAGVNVRLSRVGRAERVACVHSDVLDGIAGNVDLVISNPPYMSDPSGRQYRDGGAGHGTALSVRIAVDALARLAPRRGRLVLYTGSPFIDGRDVFLEAISGHLSAVDCRYAYGEIDPDVFGSELSRPGYERVERIAAVGLVVDLL